MTMDRRTDARREQIAERVGDADLDAASWATPPVGLPRACTPMGK